MRLVSDIRGFAAAQPPAYRQGWFVFLRLRLNAEMSSQERAVLRTARGWLRESTELARIDFREPLQGFPPKCSRPAIPPHSQRNRLLQLPGKLQLG